MPRPAAGMTALVTTDRRSAHAGQSRADEPVAPARRRPARSATCRDRRRPAYAGTLASSANRPPSGRSEDRMPTYEYRCKDCGHEFEVLQSFTDDALTECPSCGGPAARRCSAPSASPSRAAASTRTTAVARSSGVVRRRPGRPTSRDDAVQLDRDRQADSSSSTTRRLRLVASSGSSTRLELVRRELVELERLGRLSRPAPRPRTGLSRP